MAIFGRRRHGRHIADGLPDAREVEDTEPAAGDEYEYEYEYEDAAGDGVDLGGRGSGPFDDGDAPEDEVPRLDLGSVLLPVPDGSQLQVEMEQDGENVRAVHVLTDGGQFTLNAYAAPRSAALWPDIAGELLEQLRADGASAGRVDGLWGQELAGTVNDVALRFVGVDGPRWMLRGVVAGPQDGAEGSARALREMVAGAIVVRGEAPMPVRTPLPITLPEEIAQQVQQVQQVQQET